MLVPVYLQFFIQNSFSRGVPVLVPVRASPVPSPVPSVVRESFVGALGVKFFFRDLDVSKAPGSDFDELRAAHNRLKEEHGKITATWKVWDAKTKAEYFDLVGGTTGRPPDVEVEPWDEPDEGEKLRASAEPPEPAERKARALALPAAYSRRGQGAAAPRRIHVQARVPTPGAAALHDGGPQQELARPRRGARQGGLRRIAVCSSRQEGQGAGQGQGAGEA